MIISEKPYSAKEKDVVQQKNSINYKKVRINTESSRIGYIWVNNTDKSPLSLFRRCPRRIGVFNDYENGWYRSLSVLISDSTQRHNGSCS